MLAAVLAGVFAVNAVTVLRHAAYFGSDGIVNRKSVGYIDTYEFKGSLEQNIATIIDDVSHNTNQAAYDAAKAATVTRAAQFLKRRCRSFRIMKTSLRNTGCGKTATRITILWNTRA